MLRELRAVGTIAGTVHRLSGTPLARACVTVRASGGFPAARALPGGGPASRLAADHPAAAALPGVLAGRGMPGTAAARARQGIAAGLASAAGGARTSGSAVTSPRGRFFISGLRPGLYSVRYRTCAVTDGLLRRVPGGADGWQSGGRVLVSGGQVKVLPALSLRPASFGALIVTASPAWLLSHATAGALAASTRTGKIAGKVTTRSGRPLRGICVYTFSESSGTFLLTRTGKTGKYLSKPLRSGSYNVAFATGCGNKGNWLTQYYKDTTNFLAAKSVRVRAGKITQHIDAVMRPGGEITGMVTSKSGRKLTGICVQVVQTHGGLGELLSTRSGSYSGHSLPPGKYEVLFTSGCGNRGNYAPQFWKDKAPNARPTLVRVVAGKITAHISAALRPGAQIAGTVRAGSASGTLLPGICVEVNGTGSLQFFGGFAVTNSAGKYLVKGLATGKYRVFFAPGCGNNGNFLTDLVTTPVTQGKTTSVNGVLPAGGIITGVVTDSHGNPVAGVCVSAADENGAGSFGTTAADGSYRLDQLPSAQYLVSFTGGCGSKGSYAPQFYPNQSQEGAASLLSVTQGDTTAGINAAMQPGGILAGQVTDGTGKKLSGVCVEADQSALLGFGNLVSSSHGRYQMTNLPPGQYQVSFFDCAPGNLAPQSFRAQPGLGVGQLVSVQPGVITSGVGAVMRPGGVLTGTVTSRSGRPLANICVQATDRSNGSGYSGFGTTKNGRYRISQVATGRYSVEFFACGPANYADSWYRKARTPSAATPVTVRGDHTTSGIGGVMTPGGRITGTITVKATGKPLRGGCVFAFSPTQPAFGGFALTGKTGRYTIPDLNTGLYDLQYGPCGPGGANLAMINRPHAVRVTAGRTRSRINAAIPAGGSVSGAVLGGSPVVPQAGVCVDILPTGTTTAAAAPGFGFTGLGGTFTAGNLLPGSYKVFIGDPGCGSPFAPQWYNDQATEAQATVITVKAAQTTALSSATLASDGQVSGTVTGPAPAHAPLTGACVTAFPVGPAVPVIAVTSGGSYSIPGLPPGHYRVEFSSGCGVTGYLTQWWKNAGSRSKAQIITVPAATSVTGISAALRR